MSTLPAVAEVPAPVARKVPKTTEIHGERLLDDYAWLRDKADPAVAEYLEAENAWAEGAMRPTEALQKSLYDEMLSHIKETDVNVPWRKGGFFYYSRTEAGKQYPIYCRKKGSLEAAEQVTLDLNELAKGEKFMALGAYALSDDARQLAYSTDNTGFRQYTLYVKDLETGALLEKVAEKVGSVAWAADNRTVFYSVEEESTKRQYRLFRHVLGTEHHELVYEEKDEAFNLGVGRTRSEAFLILGLGSLTTSEARYLPADQPTAEFRLVAPRIAEQEYDVEHHGDHFYIRTNDTGRHFRLVKAPVSAPGRENWTEVLPHRQDVMLEGTDFFQDFSVVYERENGLPHARITRLATGEWHRIAFPEPTYSAFPGANPEFDTKLFRYNYQSLVTPNSVYDYDLEQRTSALLKRQEVPGGYDPAQYVSERLFATAKDGVKVPISLVYRKGLKRDGAAPLFLTAYGSYGFPYPVTFSSNRLALLDRGFVFAIA
ncbi:MAG TPA: oligopeptidase B, partial [Vicinamibacteria bacterium]